MERIRITDLKYGADAFTFDEYEKALVRNWEIDRRAKELQGRYLNATPKEREKLKGEFGALWAEQDLLDKILSANYYCPYCEDSLDMRYYGGNCECGASLSDFDGIGGFWNEDDEDQFDADAITV